MSDHVGAVGTNNIIQNNIEDKNQVLNNSENLNPELQNAQKSSSKLALALKITATILTGGLFGIGWGIYELVKQARKSDRNQPINQNNNGLPENTENKAHEEINKTEKLNAADLKITRVNDPVELTVEISSEQAEKSDYYLGECITTLSERAFPNMRKVTNGVIAMVKYGNVSDKFTEIVKQIGDKNTEILLKKVFGNDYNLAKKEAMRNKFKQNDELMMAVIYTMRKDSKNQEQEIFKKPQDEITGAEILEHTVMTLNNMLRENDINAEIKLQIQA